jgi:hypothetical protein
MLTAVVPCSDVKYTQNHMDSNFCFRMVKETALTLHSYVRMQSRNEVLSYIFTLVV